MGFDFAEKPVRFQPGPQNPRKDHPQDDRNVAGPVVAMVTHCIKFLLSHSRWT